ncbi:MAG: FKBP-type peptidyl-prolyl cis-trans isomerase [Planctomycetales bacterium]|nr:FKBP-type peptidyl-prolyl cis-trans isomerase [Planctomycetales bacterium]
MLNRWLRVSMICVVVTLSISIASGQDDALPDPLGSDSQKASYGYGFQTGSELINGDLGLDVEAFILGLRDAASKKETRLTDEQIGAAIQAVQQAAQSRFQTKQTAFMAKYKTLKGVKAMPNGILYKVLTAGTGDIPAKTDTVKVHYQGRFVDGNEFDSSYKRNEPAVFPLNGVIRGWTETVSQMKVGGKWQVVIPSELAYGQEGRPGIPPNSVLVFDIELLSIEQKGQ